MYLLDTNVISESAPSKKVASPELRHWMDANSDRLFLSVITVAEIVAGIEKVKRAGHEAKAGRLGNGWRRSCISTHGGYCRSICLCRRCWER
ncbi:hypothetical protein RAA17_10305 [Komagataeibacter rhaeticus]|nr:hypothetical protein [Komagataeibacter rhaeticus]